MSDIDCIILAAGANERLKGLVPSFMKPLILVNGRPLIRHAIEHGVEWGLKSDRDITIVVSPQNAVPITQVIGPHCNFVVQPEPAGVVDAIRRALPLAQRKWTLILMGDNTFDDNGIRLSPPDNRITACIAIRDDIATKRFTGVSTSTGRVARREDTTVIGNHAAWIGPLVLRTDLLRQAITVGYRTIEEVINHVSDNGVNMQMLAMKCSDLGVPEELQ